MVKNFNQPILQSQGGVSVKYSSLGLLNEYAAAINLSDLAAKVLENDLGGVRIEWKIFQYWKFKPVLKI